jgi:hypothetical protein
LHTHNAPPFEEGGGSRSWKSLATGGTPEIKSLRRRENQRSGKTVLAPTGSSRPKIVNLDVHGNSRGFEEQLTHGTESAQAKVQGLCTGKEKRR